MEKFDINRSPRFTWLQLETTDSTNNFLKSYRSEEATPITLATANYQTAGRGQRGNSWESETGKNVVYSLLIHPLQLRPSQIFSISEVAALSVTEALNELIINKENSAIAQSCQSFSIKWPNDIYYGDKKICGILIETDLMGSRITNAVIGVGVNVNQRNFVSDAPNPVSLYQILGKEVERQEVLTLIMQRFDALYQQIENGDVEVVHHHFMKQLYRREGYHAYRDEHGDFEARIVDVALSGHLTLEDTTGMQRRYAFKEVSFIL